MPNRPIDADCALPPTPPFWRCRDLAVEESGAAKRSARDLEARLRQRLEEVDKREVKSCGERNVSHIVTWHRLSLVLARTLLAILTGEPVAIGGPALA